MPFGDYEDFDACVRDNQDKRDPEAYCAAIKRQIEGADGLTERDREAIQASDVYADAILADDPCWENYTMVGTKTVNGEEVPNCVPDDDVPDANLAAADDRCGEGAVRIGDRCVDLSRVTGGDDDVPPSALSSPQRLTLSSLDTEPIERVAEGGDTVRYRNIKLLAPGIWADSASQTETYYPPEGIDRLQAHYDESEHDGPPLNIMHDLDADEWEHHEASVAGHVDPQTLDTDSDGNLFGDIVIDTSTGAGQFADENLQSTLEQGGTVGFGGPSVEIPAEGLQQSHDDVRDMPRIDGGRLTGVALVMDPASKSVDFARESARRPVALSEGEDAKVLSRQAGSVNDTRTLMGDPGEIREILEMFGMDTGDLDDEEVTDMAADLHEDLMEELQGDEEGDGAEMAEHGGNYDDEDDDEEDMEMAGDMDDMDAVQSTVANLEERLADLEDMMSQMMTEDDAQAALADADTVEELDRRLSELENTAAPARTLADGAPAEDDDGPDYTDAERGMSYDPVTGSTSY